MGLSPFLTSSSKCLLQKSGALNAERQTSVPCSGVFRVSGKYVRQCRPSRVLYHHSTPYTGNRHWSRRFAKHESSRDDSYDVINRIRKTVSSVHRPDRNDDQSFLICEIVIIDRCDQETRFCRVFATESSQSRRFVFKKHTNAERRKRSR